MTGLILVSVIMSWIWKAHRIVQWREGEPGMQAQANQIVGLKSPITITGLDLDYGTSKGQQSQRPILVILRGISTQPMQVMIGSDDPDYEFYAYRAHLGMPVFYAKGPAKPGAAKSGFRYLYVHVARRHKQ
jgi:hypothetical protein